MLKVLIAGCGFVGEATAGLFLKAGWRVFGITATASTAARLRQQGIEAVALNLADPESIPAMQTLGEMDAVIHCASSGKGGEEAYEAVYHQGCQHLLRAFPDRLLLFTSSTSVYAQTDGSWVTENSPADPDRATGRILRTTENLVLRENGLVARLAGIYGPDRCVYLRKFLEHSAILEAGGERWINQIHRDDAASALFHLITLPAASGLYNVVDDCPSQQRTIYETLAAYYGQPLPPIGPANLNRKRGWTSKRVSNAKLRATGWQPVYPNFSSALAHLGFSKPSA